MKHFVAFGLNCFAFGFCLAFTIVEFKDGQASDGFMNLMLASANALLAGLNIFSTINQKKE